MTIGPSLGLGGVMALRAQILERSQTLGAAQQPPAIAPAKGAAAGAAPAGPAGGFGAAMAEALKSVNNLQAESNAQGAAWERGDTQDIASVMLSRQKSSIAFEATLQARNRLLSAYRDIMSMPV